MHTVELKFKTCTKCGEKKPATTGYFKQRRKALCGLDSHCKNCNSAYTRINKSRLQIQQRAWYDHNKDKKLQYGKQWNKNNKQLKYKINSHWIYVKSLNDPVFAIKCRVRSLIAKAFSNYGGKHTAAANIVGCDYDFLIHHLTLTFIENYARLPKPDDELHIDHIVPISTATSEDEVIKLNHYNNLQWLLKEDNLRKSNQIDFKLFE